MYKLQVDRIRGTDCDSLIFYKSKCNACAMEDTAFTMHMFYSTVVLYYIRTPREPEISGLGNITTLDST
jgi:hypothetical protein